MTIKYSKYFVNSSYVPHKPNCTTICEKGRLICVFECSWKVMCHCQLLTFWDNNCCHHLAQFSSCSAWSIFDFNAALTNQLCWKFKLSNVLQSELEKLIELLAEFFCNLKHFWNAKILEQPCSLNEIWEGCQEPLNWECWFLLIAVSLLLFFLCQLQFDCWHRWLWLKHQLPLNSPHCLSHCKAKPSFFGFSTVVDPHPFWCGVRGSRSCQSQRVVVVVVVVVVKVDRNCSAE